MIVRRTERRLGTRCSRLDLVDPNVGLTFMPFTDVYLSTGFPRPSQLRGAFHSPNDVEAALDETLFCSGASYPDMCLIRWPVATLEESCLACGRVVVDKPLSDDMYPT